jgi:hypothetical protein
MLTINEITEIFYLSDEFSKEFEVTFKKYTLEESKDKNKGINRTGYPTCNNNHTDCFSLKRNAQPETLLRVLCQAAFEGRVPVPGFL